MSRIQTIFEQLQAAQRRALIPFITAGDPSAARTLELMHALVAGGADVIELGVPFSDPMADGPTIQQASERALAQGMTLRGVLAIVERFRATNATTPVVLMGYANPIEAMGQTQFVEAAAKVGVDGVLVVNYPPNECREFTRLLRQQGLDQIFLLAPTSTPQRVREVAEAGSGYIYYVSIKGVTGSAALDVADVAAKIAAMRAEIAMPIGVGFGIRDAQSARAIGEVADAVVIGSRIIEEIVNSPADEMLQRVERFTRDIRQALDDLPGAKQ